MGTCCRRLSHQCPRTTNSRVWCRPPLTTTAMKEWPVFQWINSSCRGATPEDPAVPVTKAPAGRKSGDSKDSIKPGEAAMDKMWALLTKLKWKLMRFFPVSTANEWAMTINLRICILTILIPKITDFENTNYENLIK